MKYITRLVPLLVSICLSPSFAQVVNPPFSGSGGGGSGTVTSVVVAGTPNQVTATGTCTITTTGTCTLSIPSAFLLPGTINKLTLTAPAAGATLTLADGSSLITVGAFAATITATATTNSTLPAGTHSLAPLDSPSFTTPTLGVASATTINKVTITAPATGATLTIPDGVTLTGPPSSATVATLGLTNTFTGRQAAGGAASTQPMKTGTSLPGTCIVGDLFFKSDATAGQNIYQCQSTDTWTQQLNSGGSQPTIYLDGVSVGSRSIINFLTDTNGFCTPLDTGTQITIQCGPSTSTMLTAATAQNITAKKSGVVTGGIAAWRATPAALPTTTITSGDFGVESTNYNFFWRDNSNNWRIPYSGVSGSPCTATQLVQAAANFGTTCVSITGSGSAYLQGGDLGTPSAGVGTNFTGIPTTALTGALPAAQEPAHTGDVTNSAGSLALAIANLAVTNAKIANSTIDLTAKVTGALPAANIGAFARTAFTAAAGCNNTTAGAAWDLPTANAPAAVCNGTSFREGALAYDDAANETASFYFVLPTGWTGNVDVNLPAYVNATSQSVKATIATVCVAASEDWLNPTFNSAQTVTVTSPGTANQKFYFTQSAVTTTGCAAGETMILKIGRDTTDTSTSTFNVIGAEVTVRITPQA